MNLNEMKLKQILFVSPYLKEGKIDDFVFLLLLYLFMK